MTSFFDWLTTFNFGEFLGVLMDFLKEGAKKPLQYYEALPVVVRFIIPLIFLSFALVIIWITWKKKDDWLYVKY